MGAARHERQRQPLRRVRRVHRATRSRRSALGLEPGEYLALLTHSGSRGTGAQVCDFYSKRAMARHEHLPKELKHLAWLSLDDADGQEYWAAMNLMGRYAAANHALIHKHIAQEARRARDPRHREPSQLRVERNATS